MDFGEVKETIFDYMDEFIEYLETNKISYTNELMPQLLAKYESSFEDTTGLSISKELTWILENMDTIDKRRSVPNKIAQCISGKFWKDDDVQIKMALNMPGFFRMANEHIRGNKDVILELIRKDGSLLSYANLEDFTDSEVENMYKIAKESGYFLLGFRWETSSAFKNYKFIMLNIEDGHKEILDVFDWSNMTEKQLRECVNYGLDKGWSFSTDTSSQVKENDVIVSLVLEKDADSFDKLPSEKQTVECFRKALEHGYRIENGLRLRDRISNSHEMMKTAIEYDSNNINYVTKQTISEELLQMAFRDKVNFKLEFLNLVSFYPEYDKMLCNYIKDQQYTLDEITEMLNGKLLASANPELLKSSSMQAIMEKLAPMIGRTADDLKNKMNFLFDGNNELFRTLDIKLLDNNFDSLGDFMLDYISCFPRIQTNLIQLSTENRKTILTMMQYVMQDTEYKSEWISVLDDLLIASDKPEYEELLKDINNNQDSLSLETIEKLIYHFTRPNVLNISSIHDIIHNYRTLLEEYCDDKVKNAHGIDDIKEAISYKMYGVDYDTLLKWNRMYCQGVSEYRDDEIKEIMKCIKNICDSDDTMKLKVLYENMPVVETDLYSKYILRTEMRVKCSQELMNKTFVPTEENYVGEKDGVQIYNAGLEFNMFVRSESGFYGQGQQENLERAWNVANKRYSYISTSYVANNNMGIWEEKNKSWIVYGFSNRNLKKSILASGPYDLNSMKDTSEFDITKKEIIGGTAKMSVAFLGPQKCIDETRYIHNETLFSLRNYDSESGKKIQPDYIVYTYDSEKIDVTDERWLNSVKAAKEFNIPIVTVNRLEIAKNEKRKIDNIVSRISQINSEDELPDFERIIIDFENNRAGMVDSFPNLIEKYFSDKLMEKTIQEVCSQIEKLQNRGKSILARKLIERFENVIKEENEKKYAKHSFDAEEVLKQISSLKEEKRININKSVGDLDD